MADPNTALLIHAKRDWVGLKRKGMIDSSPGEAQMVTRQCVIIHAIAFVSCGVTRAGAFHPSDWYDDSPDRMIIGRQRPAP